jgi:hypothetical protein
MHPKDTNIQYMNTMLISGEASHGKWSCYANKPASKISKIQYIYKGLNNENY